MAITFDGRVAGRTTFPSGYGIQADGVDSNTAAYPTGISGAIFLTDDPAGSGETVIEYTRTTAQAIAALGNRSEMWYQGPDVGDTAWYWWASYIPSSWPDTMDFCVLQLHDTPDGGDASKPPTMLGYLDEFGRFQLWNAYDTNATTTPAKNDFDRQLMQWKYPKGEWVEWVMHVTWSATAGAGSLEFWRNARKVYVETDQINTYNDTVGPHWKQGVYDYFSFGGYGSRTQYGKGLVVADGTSTTFNAFMSELGSSATELEGFVTPGACIGGGL